MFLPGMSARREVRQSLTLSRREAVVNMPWHWMAPDCEPIPVPWRNAPPFSRRDHPAVHATGWTHQVGAGWTGHDKSITCLRWRRPSSNGWPSRPFDVPTPRPVALAFSSPAIGLLNYRLLKKLLPKYRTFSVNLPDHLLRIYGRGHGLGRTVSATPQQGRSNGES